MNKSLSRECLLPGLAEGQKISAPSPWQGWTGQNDAAALAGPVVWTTRGGIVAATFSPSPRPLMRIYTTFTSQYLTLRSKVRSSFLCRESHPPWDRPIDPHLRPRTFTSLFFLPWNRQSKWSMLSQGGRMLVSCLERYNEFRQTAHNRLTVPSKLCGTTVVVAWSNLPQLCILFIFEEYWYTSPSLSFST